jgi:hypothetical protein
MKNLNAYANSKSSTLAVYYFAALLLLSSCSSEIKDNSERFKYGVFEIPAGKGYSKTTITRKDSLQIEEYDKITSISNDSITAERRVKHIDTLYITWKNNFFYTLKMKSPKQKLDKQPIFVQITRLKENGYEFTAKIGFSKFKQEGVATKIK